MKTYRTTIIGSVLAAGMLLFATGCETEKSQAALQAKAKISQAQAQQIALGQVPGGSVKEGSLEEEKGKLIWSFDIATPNTKDITEVQVDAVTGEVVSTEKETPTQEAKEKKEKEQGK